MPLMPLLVFIIMVVCLWQGLLMPQPVPPFVNNITTASIFAGKVTIAHVWSSQCGACMIDHKILTTMNKSDEFQLVGINYKDLQNSADLWLNKLGNPYTVNIFDADGKLSMDLGVFGTPTTFVIDRAGVIRYRHVGALTNDLWHTVILPELNKLIT